MWIPDGCCHAAEVRGDGLKDDHGDHEFRKSSHIEDQDGKRDKCDQGHVVRDQHAGEKAECCQGEGKLACGMHSGEQG